MGTLSQRERRFSVSGFDLTVDETLVAGLLADSRQCRPEREGESICEGCHVLPVCPCFWAVPPL